jgi:hypothetical protein
MLSFEQDPLRVAERVNQIFGDDLHARRVLSLANGVVGTMQAAVLSIHAIGRGYAEFTNQLVKHGVKQTDRMLGNPGLKVWDLFRPWAAFVVGERKEIVVALDWTEFDADDHATLAGYLITNHGRATPLIWMTVSKATLRNRRNEHEYRLIERLHDRGAGPAFVRRHVRRHAMVWMPASMLSTCERTPLLDDCATVATIVRNARQRVVREWPQAQGSSKLYGEVGRARSSRDRNGGHASQPVRPDRKQRCQIRHPTPPCLLVGREECSVLA